MQPQQNVPLSEHSTMKVGGVSAYAVEIHDRNELTEAVQWAAQHQLPMLMIGNGSNIVWRDEGFPGLLLINKILKFEAFQEDAENYYLTVGAGEIWDTVVERAVQAKVSGIEALSLIPGTAGATPVQNVGAYGQEVAQTLVSLEAYDIQKQEYVTIPNQDCGFGYRTSRFKTVDHGKFFITGLTLHLSYTNPQPPFYPALQAYLDRNHISEFTPTTIRQAVIAIRRSKLPDPAVVANCGSFFANPIILRTQFDQLVNDYPAIVHWEVDATTVKISAAWLVEQAGFKDVHNQKTGMATWPSQPLVLVNEHAHSTADLLEFKQVIVDSVKAKFGIELIQEPELLP